MEKINSDWLRWPAVVNYQGKNFIHHQANQILMGATLENGKHPSIEVRQEMYTMNNSAPNWIQNSHIKSHWYGFRARPNNQPSPILENLEPGLLLNSGHYRNGVLLAPACAEWIGNQILNPNENSFDK